MSNHILAISFSGGFSCAFTDSPQKINVIMQIFNNCRNVPLLIISVHLTERSHVIIMVDPGDVHCETTLSSGGGR